ncbi:hypothetical protein ACIRPN_09525 [Streptomyces sp. NPDC101230]|uniref:hypothetical protein n=1 Tax=unclassified Streptomyces TaxID=2593676 RepID=UPI0037F18E75
MGGAGGEVCPRLRVRLGQLAAQPGVHLGELAGRRGDRGGRFPWVGEPQDHDRRHLVVAGLLVRPRDGSSYRRGR